MIISIVDYHYPGDIRETYLCLGYEFEFAMDEIQDRPIQISNTVVEVFHRGKWESACVISRDIPVPWLITQLVNRGISYVDNR